MSGYSAPRIPHRHTIDDPRTYSSSPLSSPSSIAPPTSQSTNFPSQPRPPYDPQGRRSPDSSYGSRDRQPSASPRTSAASEPTSPQLPTRSSSSNLFTRKLLKKNRTSSSTSTATSSSSPLPSPGFPPSSPPLSPNSFTQASPPPMKPYTYSPSGSPHPSPYPSYQAPPPPPPRGAGSSTGHRSSMSSFSHQPNNFAQIPETEEEQLARIQQESLEYEQQRQMDLEAEEDRRIQQALEESAALAEQDRIRAEERERLRRMEEEIAVREALIYSREFEQAEAERLEREQRRRTLEEEKEVQRTLARSRTVNRGRESSQERQENEAFEAAARLSLEDSARFERQRSFETGVAHDFGPPERRQSHGTLQEPTDSSSSHNSFPSHRLHDQSRSSLSGPSLNSYIVANPDRSASSVGDSEDDEAPPPSYTLVAEDGPQSVDAASGLTAPIQSSISRSNEQLYPNERPLPPSGAAPSRYPSHISTGYATYVVNPTESEAGRFSQGPVRTPSTTASVGSFQPLTPSSPSLFESIPVRDSVVEEEHSRDGQEDPEDPFDDQFEADTEEETTQKQGEPEALLSTPTLVASKTGPPVVVVETAPSQSSSSNPSSPSPNQRPLPSASLDGLSAAPTPIRRVSEPPPSIPTLLPSPATPSPTSHSANNTPEPSPSLDAYPNAPSFGGVVEDSTSPSSSVTPEYLLEGMRWGFVAIDRAALHPPLDSKGAFPRGAQLSSSTSDEGKQAFLSFAIEAKSWDALLVYLTWFGRSRIEASPHDHGVDEDAQGHQVSVRIEFFRSFLDSSCRVRCRLELLPLAQVRPMSSDTTSPNASTPETTPSFDDDCPNVHILLSHRPHLPLNFTGLVSLLANVLSHSRQQRQLKSSSPSARQQSCLSEAVDFLRQLNGEDKERYDDGNDSDDVGWTNKLKSKLRKKKVRVIKTETAQSADRRSHLPEGAMLITPFSADPTHQ